MTKIMNAHMEDSLDSSITSCNSEKDSIERESSVENLAPKNLEDANISSSKNDVEKDMFNGVVNGIAKSVTNGVEPSNTEDILQNNLFVKIKPMSTELIEKWTSGRMRRSSPAISISSGDEEVVARQPKKPNGREVQPQSSDSATDLSSVSSFLNISDNEKITLISDSDSDELLIDMAKRCVTENGNVRSSDSNDSSSQKSNDERRVRRSRNVQRRSKDLIYPDGIDLEHYKSASVNINSLSDDFSKVLEKFNLRKIRHKRRVLAKTESASESESPEPQRKTKTRVKKTVISDSESESNSKSDASTSDASDSDFSNKQSSNDSDSDFETQKSRLIRKKRTRDSDSSNGSEYGKAKSKQSRLKRIKKNSSSDDSDASNKKTPKGRKHINKILQHEELAKDTLEAAEAEKERKKRIAERQKLFNETFDLNLEDNAKVTKLVLDFDLETKEELVKVDEGLVQHLKPHQVDGIKFMWDACFESVERIAGGHEGGGCILAHCMGLGKTLQIVTLVQTLLAHREQTNVKSVLVICPVSTVLNWCREFEQWLERCDDNNDLEVLELSKYKQNFERADVLKHWHKNGDVMIMGYDMFRRFASETGRMPKRVREKIRHALLDPGPDLVVCDEGHLLKNNKTALSKSVNMIRTKRRIALTGTPLQNNLKEYYCMVQFVKPNLLGTYQEYCNRFVNPISNGQYHDSSHSDIQLMKRRSHILHKLLDGCVQRKDYGVLAPFLSPKHEYALYVPLTKLQVDLYKYYVTERPLNRLDDIQMQPKVFQDFQNFQRIWTHPMTMRVHSDRYEEALQKQEFEDDDEEGSLKDFIDDEDDTASSSTNSSDDSEEVSDSNKKAPTVSKSLRSSKPEAVEETVQKRGPNLSEWWMTLCPEDELGNLEHSNKLKILFQILKECEEIGDKVLVFSQSLYSLDVIEYFLEKIDDNSQNGNENAKLGGFKGSWAQGLDYFRLDGSHSMETREIACRQFNKESNPRARLFLISTKAGGLGINLVAANRAIIFDVSWNPSNDIQSIFRIYRFGQTKPCYVYRLVALGTMEEKIYERQIAKLAIAKRVIDEEQIDRHYSANDLQVLYQINLEPEEPRPTPILPKDRLLAELLNKETSLIYKYHEHDSLLENKYEETLTQAEIDAAWKEFEYEKDAKAKEMTSLKAMEIVSKSQQLFNISPTILGDLVKQYMRNEGHDEMFARNHLTRKILEMAEAVQAGDRTMYEEILKLQKEYNERVQRQQMQRINQADHLYGFDRPNLMRLLRTKLFNEQPYLTEPQIQQHIALLITKLQETMSRGDTSVYQDLLALDQQLQRIQMKQRQEKLQQHYDMQALYRSQPNLPYSDYMNSLQHQSNPSNAPSTSSQAMNPINMPALEPNEIIEL